MMIIWNICFDAVVFRDPRLLSETNLLVDY